MEGPSNVPVERKALAQGVYAPDWWDGSGLQREDFTGERRLLYDAIEVLKLRDAGKHLSWPNVRLELDKTLAGSGSVSFVGGVVEEFMKVIEQRGRPTELELEALHELRQCRSVGQLSRNLAEAIDTGDVRRVREVLDAASDVAGGEQTQGLKTAHELAVTAHENILNPQSQEGWAHLGLTNFDGHLGRAAPGTLFTIGARPNVGKSGCVLSMAEGAIPRGTRVGLISLEDGPDILGPRLLALKSGVSARQMQRRTVAPFNYPKLRDAIELLKDFPFFVEFVFGGDHVAVRHAMRKLSRRGVNLVFVDYLQVMRYGGKLKIRDRNEQIGHMITDLKVESFRCHQAMVLLSQLRRTDASKRVRARGESRTRPDIEELKQSGDIEEKSDLVALLWRDSKEDDAIVKCEIAKGKWGGVGYEFELRRGDDGILREVKPYADTLF